jgi:glycosyltransferase involved in cell wall biosynthesis
MKDLAGVLGGLGFRVEAPERADRALARADHARDAKQWHEAAAAYAAAVAFEPNAAPIWVQYGHALKESGQHVKAEEAYRTALSLDATVPDTHLQLGHLLKLMDRQEEAAKAYLAALDLDPTFEAAMAEFEALVRRGVKVTAGTSSRTPAVTPRQASLETAAESLSRLLENCLIDADGAGALEAALAAIRDQIARSPDAVAPTSEHLVFDVADLIGYYRHARLPTGIQRVQLEIVRGLLRDGSRSRQARVCAFAENQDDWVEIPPDLFIKLCETSLENSDQNDPRWTGLLRRLDIVLLSSKPFDFPEGAALINLGTSWWLQNYFLRIRNCKRKHNITYIPFVHDFIPVMMPEHCVDQLTQDFISWVLGVFQHADMFFVNSEATKRDLIAVAQTLGHAVSPSDIEVVRLDADCRTASAAGTAMAPLAKWGLGRRAYVLMVSTIESRKNHIGAFNAWLSLIGKHGAEAMPDLVCVGNAGWLNAEVHAKLAASPVLQSKVKLLSHLSDAELTALYRNCLFKLYPSHYEGWGLPVTEALCHGKAVLCSDASSLPEAGGVFADYFCAGSDRDLAAAAERLIFDEGYRTGRESQILAKFKPRPWADLGAQIAAAIDRMEARIAETGAPRRVRAGEPMSATVGAFYPMVRNFERRIWRGMVLTEMFRAGVGWWWPDDWGAWTKPEGGDIAIRIEGPHGPLRLWFRIRGLLDAPCRWSFDVAAPAGFRPRHGNIGPDERQWLQFDLPASVGSTDLMANLSADGVQDLAIRTGNLDRRVTSVGLVGFFICERDDLAQRIAFSEAAILDDFKPLTPGYEASMSNGANLHG